MSGAAALSSRQELYPRGMQAERALRLGLGAVSGLGLPPARGGISGNGRVAHDRPVFPPDAVQQRIAARYPEAEPLPGHPELGALLDRLGIEVEWVEARGDAEAGYRRRGAVGYTTASTVSHRLSSPPGGRASGASPEEAEAKRFADRLRHAHAEGGFLVLSVGPKWAGLCENGLLAQFSKTDPDGAGPGLERVSFDALFFQHLRAAADEYEVDWEVVRRADGAGRNTEDWRNLLQLAGVAGERAAADLLGRNTHTLLVHPGLIARYDLMGVLETLRDRAGHPDACPGVWVLVPTDEQQTAPTIDGAAVPLITPGQRASVPERWIRTADRRHSQRHLQEGA